LIEAEMQINEYLITQHDQSWCVLSESDQYRTYLTRKEAIDASLALALADFAEERFAIVMLDEDGERTCLYDSTIRKGDPVSALVPG
jgi:hypothetical protein